MTVSNVTPDFQLLYDQLSAKLAAKPTWIDTLPTSVGTTILDLFAGSSVSNQYYIDVSLREAFLPVAVRDTSIFAGTRMLGVNIARKTCASLTAELSNYSTSTKYVPPYTQFDVNGVQAFVRSQYVIPPGQTISNVNMYVGTYAEQTISLADMTDLALKEFFLNEPGFVVSEADLLVFTRNRNTGSVTSWTKTDKAIFEHTADDTVYFGSTTRDGDVSLFFGDGQFGKALSLEEDLIIQYAKTTGAAGNVGLPGLAIKQVSDTSVKGKSISAIAGGSDEKNSLYYKMFAPNMARTKRRSISTADIRSTIMGIAGVADCATFGQRDIAPNDYRWMNTIRICLLPENDDVFGGTNPNPKSAAWQSILDVLRPMLHDAYNIQTWNPSKLFVNVKVRIALLPTALDGEVQIAAAEAILKLFKKKPGILGRRLSQSDIMGAIKGIKGVDYVIVDSPIEEVIPSDATSYVVLNGIPDISTFYSERSLSV